MRLTEPLADTPFGVWVLRVFLGCAFLVAGVANVTGFATTEHAFAVVGLPDALRVVIGVVEIVAGAALFVPGLAVPAAGALGVCMFVMLVARVTHGNLITAAITGAMLGACAIVARGGYLERAWRPDDPIDPNQIRV